MSLKTGFTSAFVREASMLLRGASSSATFAFLCAAAIGCPAKSGAPGDSEAIAASASGTEEANSKPTSAAPVTSTSASPAPAPASYPGKINGCSGEMVRVEGEYCPALMQNCLEHHSEFESLKGKTKTVSERCVLYESPSRCVSKKRKYSSFCMDRFEYPNKLGEKPRVLTSWTHAKKLCEGVGKRLCTEDEFNFACEGPDMLPYVYGFKRDKNVCNIDKDYRYPDHSKVMLEYDECLLEPWCKAEIERLDQREPIGQRTSCVSWAGVYDLNGNANEWVEIPKEKPPNRSGLKGGWWGPVRGRCRPTVTFHKESDYGYEAGFRCCTDAK